MTSEQFRSDSTLLSEARKLIDSDIFKLMDRIVDLESPHRLPIKIAGDTAANIQLGRIIGFEERGQRFTELTLPLPKPAEETPTTYTDTTHQEEEDHAGSS